MPEQPPFNLMYRRPGGDDYEKLTDAIDYLFNRVTELEAKLEEADLDPGLTD